MKKTIISIVTAAVCALVLSVTAFAEDILSNKSVYANERESIAKVAGSFEWMGEVVYADPNTIMPYYYAHLLDYAQTGKLEIIPYAKSYDRDNGRETFVANAVNADGEFAGTVRLDIGGSYPGIRVFNPSDNKADSIAFEPNARRISAGMNNLNINSDCQEVKLVFVEWLGDVYYIDNGTSQYFAASNFGWVNGEIFNKKNGGIVEINEDFKAFADRKLAEYEEYKREVLDKLAPGENPPEGGYETPMFRVDNTPYLDSPGSDNNPITGSDTRQAAALAIGLAALSVSAVGVKAVSRKRKNER